jgi:hypothetical protein
MIGGFLDDYEGRPWDYGRADEEYEYYLGEGTSQLEIVLTERDERPTQATLQQLYRDRRENRANPILVVVLYDETAAVCGPSGEDPPIYREVDRGQIERVCQVALKRVDRLAAQQFLSNVLPQLDGELTGVRNQGLLSTHELRVGVPERDDWPTARDRAQSALTEDPRALIENLGYDVDRLTDQSFVLSDADNGYDQAVAVFLEDDEAFDHSEDRFVGQTPVAYALNEADKRNVEYVVGCSGDTLRLYTTNPDAGFGSRGRTDTYVEVNTNLLADEKAGYLWLLFSAEALRDGGTLADIMERSKEYSTDLGRRLRERIYDDVIPDLAEAIADARDLEEPNREELDETYRMALILLYRLLFIAYAEDEGFLPRHRNSRYDDSSLKQKARRLHELVEEGNEFDPDFTDHWDDVMRLSRSIHHGHDELGLPAYDGRLLSEDESISEAGARLSEIRLDNAKFGPVLVNLLIDENEDGYQGPVDFRNIGVREFGVIYEGLLESELSVADQPLGIEIDDGKEHYVPAEPDGGVATDVVVEEGEVYLHGQSGERKATGTYYTKTRFVEHILDYSLEPALDDHIERIDRLREKEGDQAAADAFFDLRLADIAMGSGHFLVGAVDRIESRLYSYLTEHSLPPVEEELDNLQDAALEAFDDEEYMPDIERGQLLRRQVARRCIYGVDLNELATELARLSLWVHTFVPGLPLTFLEYNLRTGDSMVGIGTVGEASSVLGASRGGNQSLASFASGDVMDEIREDIEALGNYSDTSAEQVAEVRQTRREIESQLKPVRARFDILAAARLDDSVNAQTASEVDIDPEELSSYETAQEVLDPFDVFHFPAEFPEVFMQGGGFDVIVGNPPWDKVRFEPQQFWVTRHPGLNTIPASRRDEHMERLRERYPQQARDEARERQHREQYQEYIKHSFVDQGRGHYDYSKLFVERATDILNDDGDLGYVLPRQSLVLAGWKKLRRRLFDGFETTVLQARNTGQWIFDTLEGRYMIVLVTSSPSEETNVHVWPAIEEEQAIDAIDIDTSIYLSREDLANLTTEDRLVVPWFNDDGARDVFPKMESQPRLSEDEGWVTGKNDARWDFRGSGRHSHLSNSEQESHHWRAFMTRSVDQFEINEEKEFRRFIDPEQLYETGEAINKSDSGVHLGEDHPTVTFRHVSRNDDTRTIIATMLPESGFIYCSGYVHAVAHESSTPTKDLFALLGYLNSFTCDWWVRRIVDRHVTAPSINNLPIPDWDEDQRERAADLAAELTRRGGIETLPGGRTVPQDTGCGELDRDEIRARIESVVTDGFGIRSSEMETILQDFSDKACPSELEERITALVAESNTEPVGSSEADDE